MLTRRNCRHWKSFLDVSTLQWKPCILCIISLGALTFHSFSFLFLFFSRTEIICTVSSIHTFDLYISLSLWCLKCAFYSCALSLRTFAQSLEKYYLQASNFFQPELFSLFSINSASDSCQSRRITTVVSMKFETFTRLPSITRSVRFTRFTRIIKKYPQVCHCHTVARQNVPEKPVGKMSHYDPTPANLYLILSVHHNALRRRDTLYKATMVTLQKTIKLSQFCFCIYVF